MNARRLIEAEDPKRAMRGGFGRNLEATLADLDLDFVKSGTEHLPNLFTAQWTWQWQSANSVIKGSPLGSHPTDPVFAINDLRNRTEQESGVLIKTRLYDEDISAILAWGRKALAAGDFSDFRPYRPPMGEAEQMVSGLLDENLDSLEGGADDMEDYYKGREWMRDPEWQEYARRRDRMRPRRHTGTALQFRPTPGKFADQWPKKPEWHPGHRSARMSTNRNVRRKSFGYKDYNYSLRDRQWPYANRGFDRRMKAYDRSLSRFGEIEPPGGGI